MFSENVLRKLFPLKIIVNNLKGNKFCCGSKSGFRVIK